MDDLDPAAPTQGETLDARAIDRANHGDPAEKPPVGSKAPEPDLGTPATLLIDRAAALAFLSACTEAHPRVVYKLGAKISPHGAMPGRDFTAVDCSGFVRELIWRATAPHFDFKDGSVTQHEWVEQHGFRHATMQDGGARDGGVRIAFLAPANSPHGVGHVVLIHNAMTLESHGGVGPDSRAWTGTDWQASAVLYVLDPRPID